MHQKHKNIAVNEAHGLVLGFFVVGFVILYSG